VTAPSVSSLDAYLGELRDLIETGLAGALGAGDVPAVLAEPVRYALIAPGKRLRPCLTLAAAERVGAHTGLAPAAARAIALPAACAVEMIHTYSLVHDDLPARDNDALRRGRPTTHVVYGDGLAILAGDALLTDAFGVLAGGAPPPGLTAEAFDRRRLRAIARLAEAAGSAGMVGGQAIDLTGHAGGAAAEDGAALEDMHLRKTGALIRAAATMGAIMAGGDAQAVAAIDAYARDLGLAFQIVDDVLDVEESAGKLGKTAGKDAAAGKPTFPARYGLDESKRLAEAAVARARTSLAGAGLDGWLTEIADWSLRRRS
jgi:geranylgeranyl diphosphate synthase type II